MLVQINVLALFFEYSTLLLALSILLTVSFLIISCRVQKKFQFLRRKTFVRLLFLYNLKAFSQYFHGATNFQRKNDKKKPQVSFFAAPTLSDLSSESINKSPERKQAEKKKPENKLHQSAPSEYSGTDKTFNSDRNINQKLIGWGDRPLRFVVIRPNI